MRLLKPIILFLLLTGILLIISNKMNPLHKNQIDTKQSIENPVTNADEQKATPRTLFVQTQGTHLMLNGKPFTSIGVNDYDLAYRSTPVIDQTFATLQKAGVTTIRFWLFGDGQANGFQPQPGVINEERFKQADYILYEAKKYNIKVIPVLVNNWKDYGGKDKYIEWIGKDPAADETVFYTDTKIKSMFESYIGYVFTRKNTYTNLTYMDDPSILGWDIMNEPRSSDNASMNDWLATIASDMKAHDPNHLVFAGTEIAAGDITSEGKSSQLCVSSFIDICSVHLYLFNETKPLFATYDQVTMFMKSQEDYAAELNKPLLLEEFGIATDTRPFGQDQLPMMRQLLSIAAQDNYAGFLIWHWSDTVDSPFVFSPNQGNYSLADLEKLLH